MASDDAIDEAVWILTTGMAEETIQLVAAYVALYGVPPEHVPGDAVETRIRALVAAHDL